MASTSLGGNTPRQLNDGNATGTRWESVQGLDNQWVQIDLGDVYDLVSSKIIWEGASAKEYDMLVSGNGENWTGVGTKTSTTGARTDEFYFIAGEVPGIRYIRLDLKTRTTIYGFSIYEWEIYGTLNTTVISEATKLEIRPEDAVLLVDLPEDLEILSLNNSLIDYNNQNELFNQLATAGGKTANWTKQTHLGQTLRYHYEESTTSKSVVASKHWTHIILQEQSSKPLTDYADFLASVKLWKEYVRTNCPNPYAKIILFMNWPYTDAVDFEGDMAQLYANYESAARELDVSVCPVGKAFDLVRTTDGETAKNALYSDNRHPTLQASYMAACAVYATLFDETPVGNTYLGGLASDLATRMQTRAWNVCEAHEDVVDDINGKVRYSVQVLDQFNRPMNATEAIVWSVDDGGTIENGIFAANGTPGTYNVFVRAGTLTGNTSIEVVKALLPGQIVDDTYFAEIDAENAYAQNFDAIGTEATATLPVGWKIEKRLDAPRTIGSFTSAVNQTEQAACNNIASDTKNGIYNFGEGTDRAIGGVSTGIANGTRCINMYLKLKNTGTTDIGGLTVEYTIEKYRKGLNSKGFVFQLYYSADGQVWTSAGNDFYTFFAADSETAGYAQAPGVIENVSAGLEQKLSPDDVIYLAWNYSVASGTDAQAAQALGLDDVKISAIPSTGLPDFQENNIQLIYNNGILKILGNEIKEASVYNLNGNKLIMMTGTDNDISHLIPGVYMVQVMESGGKMNVYKIVI